MCSGRRAGRPAGLTSDDKYGAWDGRRAETGLSCPIGAHDSYADQLTSVLAVQRDATLACIRTVTALDNVAEIAFVIEVVPKNVIIRRGIVRALVPIVRDDVIPATNTSGISMTDIGQSWGRSARVVDMHFFNPPPLIRLVEVVQRYETSEKAMATVRAVAERCGKTVVEVKGEEG